VNHAFFISHHHSDRDLADRICETLESNGIRSWIAPRDVPPGKEWAGSIVEAIESAKALLLVFSGRANDSPQVKREMERAVHLGVPIVPVRVEAVEPNKTMSYFLGLVHWFDAIGQPLEACLPELITHAKLLLAELRAAQESPAPTGQVESSKRLLQDFLDRISRALPTLKTGVGPQADEAARVLRAQTLSALPKMNAEEKGIALRVLHLAGLVEDPQPRVSLAGADLSGADLAGAVLPHVCLFSSDLSRADLRGANLTSGTLMWANIDGVRFDGARLDGVVIVGNEIEDAGLDPLFLRSLGADVRRPD
jgi:uncharacterized protein YjbI with pentapeptide repeats